MTESTFLPDNYETPKSHYTKFKAGSNLLRILSRPIVGWVDWKDSKPYRFRMTEKPAKAMESDGRIKHFWAFVVWNYLTKQIEVCEITQSGIQKTIESLSKNPKWGSPLNYDIDIVKEGEGLLTEYTVMANPKEELTQDIAIAQQDTPVNLEALFSGDDPFAKE